MNEVLYEATPSMVRIHPLGTIMMILLVFLGIYLAISGDHIAAAIGLPAVNSKIVGLIGIVLVVIGFVQLLAWWIATKFDHLKVTGDEIMWTHGLLNKQYTEIHMSSVRTVRVAQTLLQRIMNAGDITIYTAGDEPELQIRGLPAPDEIRQHVKG
jgi:uncharacterized membrane protein YdbT with pleckstrin-like domain